MTFEELKSGKRQEGQLNKLYIHARPIQFHNEIPGKSLKVSPKTKDFYLLLLDEGALGRHICLKWK